MIIAEESDAERRRRLWLAAEAPDMAATQGNGPETAAVRRFVPCDEPVGYA